MTWEDEDEPQSCWCKQYHQTQTPGDALKERILFVGTVISVMVIAVALLNLAGRLVK